MTARILVVDDIPAIRHSMRLYLEQEADWVICGEAENGKAAIDRVQELRPDVVILDLSMPIMNGARRRPCNQSNSSHHSHPHVHPAHLPIPVGRGPEGGY